MADAHDPTAIPLDTITAAFARAVAEVPERIYLDFEGETYTYAEVDRLSTSLAHGLAGIGIGGGDVVATVLDNSIDAVTVWLAVNKLGAISAPVNTAFKGEFLRAQLHDATARVVVAEGDYAGRVLAVAGELPHLERLLVRGATPPPEGDARTATLDSIRSNRGDPLPDVNTPESTAMLIYTSGTTGRSKGCVIPHNFPCNLGWNVTRARSISRDDVLWSPLPLFHMNAIAVSIVCGMIAQCRVAIARRFSVSNFWPEIERSGATIANLLGSMAALIAQAPDSEAASRCFGRLRQVNAAPFAAADVERWRQRFGVHSNGAGAYGMTEAATIATLSAQDPPGPPGNSGRSGNDFDIAIVDDRDVVQPAGVAGEMVCRPRRPHIMFKGYWNRHDETVKTWRNLWFHTGDIGRLDENGYLFFVDRKKDYIRRRGENISTFELEAVFRGHDAILDVAVHSVLSPLGEDEVKVTAQLVPEATLSEEELCRWSIERLPYFAVPLYIEFRADLPRNPTGKVLKEELRAEGRTAATWDREAAGVTFTRR